MLMNICNTCNNKIATHGEICNICYEEQLLEFEKCKENPYYFMTKYWKVNGKLFTTILSEEEFNNQFKNLKL